MRALTWTLLITATLAFAGCDTGTGIKAMEPNFGNVSGGDTVLIIGSGFKTGMTVQFGKHEVKHVVVDTPSRLRVKTPSGAEGKVNVIVTRDDGKTFMLENGFEYRRDVSGGK